MTGIQCPDWKGSAFVDRDGRSHRAYEQTNKRVYGTREAWEADVAAKLKAWRFNLIGHGSGFAGRGFAAAPTIAFARQFCLGKDPDRTICNKGILLFPNVFHPDFASECRRIAAAFCGPRKDDPEVLGYFSDNEISWRGLDDGKRPEGWTTGLFDAVAGLPDAHSAKRRLNAFLSARGGTADAADFETKAAFQRLCAEEYFRLTSAAIRAADPNHLVMGARFIQFLETNVWPVAGKYCDVVSANLYPWADLDRGTLHYNHKTEQLLFDRITEMCALAGGKPLLITEWSFLALDAGLGCRLGSGQRFYTQAERTRAAELFAKTLAAHPGVVGWIYFRWVDQPRGGVATAYPENGNYGLVSEYGETYPIADMLGNVQNAIGRWRLSPPPESNGEDAERIRARHLCARDADLRRGSPEGAELFCREADGTWRISTGAFSVEVAKGKGPLVRKVVLGDDSLGELLAGETDVAEGAWRLGDDGLGRLTVRLTKGKHLTLTFAPGRSLFAVDGRTVRFRPAFVADETRKPAEHWNLWRPVTGAVYVGKEIPRIVRILSRAPVTDLSTICEFE